MLVKIKLFNKNNVKNIDAREINGTYISIKAAAQADKYDEALCKYSGSKNIMDLYNSAKEAWSMLQIAILALMKVYSLCKIHFKDKNQAKEFIKETNMIHIEKCNQDGWVSNREVNIVIKE